MHYTHKTSATLGANPMKNNNHDQQELKKLPLTQLAKQLRETKKERRRIKKEIKALRKQFRQKNQYETIASDTLEAQQKQELKLAEEFNQLADKFWALQSVMQTKAIKRLIPLIIILTLFSWLMS
jgi:hypothetical protein